MSGIEIKVRKGEQDIEEGKDYQQEDGEVKKEEVSVEQDSKPREELRGKKVERVEDMTKKELLKKLKDTEKKVQESQDLYLRTYAEMENIKKRGMKEREELAKFANESLIKEILPVIDNLNKAISHGHNDEDYEGLLEGLELTLDGLIKTLEKTGLEQVEAEGKPFDPALHEAISQQRDDHVAPGHVSIELQKGYLLNGRLIRPSMVVISQGNNEIK